MDPRLQKIVDNMDNMRIGVDEEFKFSCTQCGKCCKNREDILCTPKDVFRISKKLGISTYDFIKRYCDTYLGDTSHMPMVRIVPHDAAGHCPLLENNMCIVHECKPVVCAMYPIRRTACIEPNDGEVAKLQTKDIRFIFNRPACNYSDESHTVREWLEQFNIPLEDEYFVQWYNTFFTLSPLIQKGIARLKINDMNQIINLIFVKLYLDYDLEQDFYPQFIANRDMMIKLMNDLPIHGGE